MRGVNKIILIGALGADPDTRYTQSGKAITRASLATSEQWTDKQTGQKQERTEWHRLSFFGRLAEIAGEYLKKGATVYVEGSLHTSKYTDKEGIERYSTEVVVSNMQMFGGKRERGNEGNEAPARTGRQSSAAKREAAPAQEFDDDDIPF